MTKAILKIKLLSNIYFLLLLFIVFFPIQNIFQEKLTFITFSLVLLLPVLAFILKIKFKLFLEGLLYFCFLVGVIFLSFRTVREMFDPPLIGEHLIVGYAQYYGYPLYFEAVILFIVLLSPFIILSLMKIKKTYFNL